MRSREFPVIYGASFKLAGLERRPSSILVASYRHFHFSSGSVPVPGGIFSDCITPKRKSHTPHESYRKLHLNVVGIDEAVLFEICNVLPRQDASRQSCWITGDAFLRFVFCYSGPFYL